MVARKYEMRVNENRLLYLASIGKTMISDEESHTTPEKIVQIIRKVYHVERLAEEHLYMLAFDVKMHLIGLFELSHGTVDASYLSPSVIIQRAMLCGAKTICIVHNHPSGSVEPSVSDIRATKRLKEAAQICDLILCDHIIVAGAHKDDFYSFKVNSNL